MSDFKLASPRFTTLNYSSQLTRQRLSKGQVTSKVQTRAHFENFQSGQDYFEEIEPYESRSQIEQRQINAQPQSQGYTTNISLAQKAKLQKDVNIFKQKVGRKNECKSLNAKSTVNSNRLQQNSEYVNSTPVKDRANLKPNIQFTPVRTNKDHKPLSPLMCLEEEERKELLTKHPELVKAAEDLFDRLSKGIICEQNYCDEQTQKLYQSSSMEYLQRQGTVINDLGIKQSGQLHGFLVYSLSLTQGKNLPFHSFQQGDSIRMSLVMEVETLTTSVDEFSSITAHISQLSKKKIEIHINRSEQNKLISLLRFNRNFRIDKFNKGGTLQRQLQALQKLLKFIGKSNKSELMVRNIILGQKNTAELAKQQPSWGKDKFWFSASAQRFDTIKDQLNESQQKAVKGALSRSFTLWQGPPGTGKTLTQTAFVDIFINATRKQLGHSHKRNLLPILVSADTNAAVDNMVEGLLERGIRVIRAGVLAKVRPSLQKFTIHALSGNTKKGKLVLEYRNQAQQIREGIDNTVLKYKDQKQLLDNWMASEYEKARKTEEEALEIEIQVHKDIFDKCEVVATTCAGSGDLNQLHFLQNKGFKVVVLDESSQSTEASVLIALTQGAEQVICAGDPQQLPPFVQSKEAFKYNLNQTLFDRLQNLGVAPYFLNTQYRMHPIISEFPSRAFYGGQIQNGELVKNRESPKCFPWPNQGNPYALIVSENCQEEYEKQYSNISNENLQASILNKQEIYIVMTCLETIFENADVDKIETIAIISPYNGQVRALEVEYLKFESKYPDNKVEVTIASIDSFQGQEADLVIFSAARCNNRNKVGFLSDSRRMNVALTRAKRGMIVIGSPSTLQSNHLWNEWVEWIKENNLLMYPQSLPNYKPYDRPPVKYPKIKAAKIQVFDQKNSSRNRAFQNNNKFGGEKEKNYESTQRVVKNVNK